MTYRLYNRRCSGGFVVEVTLTLAETAFELVELESELGTELPDSFREINPWGQVPVLILPDGTTMTETAGILIYLAAQFPNQKLAPAPGTSAYASFLRWTVFASVNVYEAVARSSYPHRFTTDLVGRDAIGAAATQRMREALGIIEAHVEGPYLLGPDMSVADIYIAMLYLWSGRQVPTPNLDAIIDQVQQHPVVSPIWERHYGDW